MDIYRLNPIDYISKCFVPSMFVVAKDDNFVKPHHGEAMYKLYGGDKNILRVEGDHNSLRPQFLNDSIAIFFSNILNSEHNNDMDSLK